MKALIAIVTAAGLLAATSAFAADGNFDKTLNVSGSAILTVSTGSGYIHVNSGSDNQIHIVAHLRASHSWIGPDADSRIKQIVANPPIHQVGNIVTVGEHQHDLDDLFRNITIDYDVTTPKATTLKVATGSGDVKASNLNSDLNAHTGSGDVQAENIAAKVHLETGSGSIHAHGVRGQADLQTGSGDIELQETAAGDVKAQTGSGSIRLSGLSGGLHAGTGSGDITVNGQLTSDWKLDTGSGSVRLNVGSGSRFTLNAETGSGSLNIQQPVTMQGNINKHHITGTVNGGGPTLRAQTGSGDITIN